MPHLTAAGVAGAGTAVGMGVGVPGYAHPLVAPLEWAELARPGAPVHWAVLDVGGGPGDRPDPHCREAAGMLRRAGVRLLGHIGLADGARPYDEVVADAVRFLDWYKVDGYYLDSCPTGRTDLAGVRRITATLEVLTDGAAHLVLGHGAHPYPGYAEMADQLVTFSGPWAEYRWSQAPEWTAEHPERKFVHLVHGVPRTHLEEALRVARWQGAGTVFMTDRRAAPERNAPFQALPGYWDEIVSRIGQGVSE
ncbi:spherulation-specific family 4 protein [Streptomyces sp. NPDC048717]|uniref:spherulation-specific family 4 protein n=1 Tax=unclassified Streptomyces TaxID=2593676 RepID=UPI003429DF75